MDDDLTIGEIGRTVARVEVKLDRMSEDHERRLRRLEAWMFALPTGVIAAILGAVVALFK